MELRFLPNTMTTTGNGMNGYPPHNGNGVSPMVSPQSSPSPLTITPTDMQLPPLPHRRTLERSLRNFNNINHQNGGVMPNGIGDKMMDGDCGVAQVRTSSMRRSKRNNQIEQQQQQGSVPSSPRITRGSSTDLVQHKFVASPIPIRAQNAKRAARLGRAENMSNGSLNSIEV